MYDLFLFLLLIPVILAIVGWRWSQTEKSAGTNRPHVATKKPNGNAESADGPPLAAEQGTETTDQRSQETSSIGMGDARTFANHAGQDVERWRAAIGLRVRHERFGYGENVSVVKQGSRIVVAVRFDVDATLRHFVSAVFGSPNGITHISVGSWQIQDVERGSVAQEPAAPFTRPETSREETPDPPAAPVRPRIRGMPSVITPGRAAPSFASPQPVLRLADRCRPVRRNYPDGSGVTMYKLGDYHPWYGGTNPLFDDRSRRILDLKKCRPDAVSYFVEELDPVIRSGVLLAVVPSSDAHITLSGTRLLAQRLVARGRRDATGCLVRTVSVPKNAHGASRELDKLLHSIQVLNRHVIAGEHVLLLDDVGTTGNSLLACRLLLTQAGASQVTCLVLGWTATDDSHPARPDLVVPAK